MNAPQRAAGVFIVRHKNNQYSEVSMAKRTGMHKYEKRQKELKRKKKQEEKRLKRQKSIEASSSESETVEPAESDLNQQSADTE